MGRRGHGRPERAHGGAHDRDQGPARPEGRRTKAITGKLESALDDSLIAGKLHPDLLDLNDRETDILAILMVEYLSVLSGAEGDRLVGLAAESGLVGRYFARLRSRKRWRKARAAENLG